MSAYRIIGGDVGTTLVFTLREWPVGTPPTPNTDAPVLNVATATNLRLVLIPPPGVLTQGATQQTVVASLYTDGTDGKIKYTTIAGDIPAVPWGGAPQLWHVRASLTIGGWAGKSGADTLWVDP